MTIWSEYFTESRNVARLGRLLSNQMSTNRCKVDSFVDWSFKLKFEKYGECISSISLVYFLLMLNTQVTSLFCLTIKEKLNLQNTMIKNLKKISEQNNTTKFD